MVGLAPFPNQRVKVVMKCRDEEQPRIPREKGLGLLLKLRLLYVTEEEEERVETWRVLGEL